MDNNILQLIINILVSVGAIPWIVNLIKKFIPKAGRFAPIIVVVLAGIYVLIANAAGLNTDFTSIYNQLMLTLGLSGGSVLAYDTIKTTIKGK